MVNFRFHLVSLVAVFLALGVGIIVGSTVIDQATVQGLERNVDALRGQRTAAREERDEARRLLAHWQDFESELPGELLAGRLTDVPVVVVAVQGVDADVTDRLHEWVTSAGAGDLGTLTLTSKLALGGDDERRQLASILDVGAGRRETLLRSALDALATALNPPVDETPPPPGLPPDAVPTTVGLAQPAAGPELLEELVAAGFLAFDPPEGDEIAVTAIPTEGLRIVLVASDEVELDNGEVAVPLAGLLAEQPGLSLVAADATPLDAVDVDGAPFAGAIRDDGELRRRVSTVDTVGEGYGQVALVLALEDLAGGAVGHYGVAGDQLLPPPNP